MTFNTEQVRSILGSKMAEKYKMQGFEVIIEPRIEELPFDLGGYRPDLIVKKPHNEGHIIEIKSAVARMPIDRYREIAEIVSQHIGWSFLLVTGEDVPSGNGDLLSWEQMRQRQIQAKQLLSLGESEGAFLSLWMVLEAAMRQQAKQVSIPIERFPTLSLINHLYSQGELSIEQFDRVKLLQTVRNRFVHGYQTPNLSEPTKQLQELVNELLALWAPQ